MNVYYLAHPVRPLPGSTETVESNLRDAEWWLVTLQRANPGVAIIAPWIQEIRLGVGEDTNPEHRQLGLRRCYGVASMPGITGVLVCGPRIGEGSLGEIRAAADLEGTDVHRFIRRDQDMQIVEPYLTRRCEFSCFVPSWLQRTTFGSTPSSIEMVGAEVLEALKRYVVRP